MSSMSLNNRKFMLADANSFYAESERVMRPDLRGKPIVVLSNNDGCVIAQSKEAKAILELYMCKPWFEVEHEAKKLGVTAFSSNYELYANMSTRFMDTLKPFAPRQEVYSIDESFLDVTGMNKDFVAYGHLIKDTVLRWTGLPICVGTASTKTLAKLANHCAKKQAHFNGVCDFTSINESELNAMLEMLPLEKVWGIGKRLEARLNALGVHNVLRLKRANLKRIRDEFGVVLERTIIELNGEAWLDLEESLPEAKEVMSSRSFGSRVESIAEMAEAISYHASNACNRMRKRGLYAGGVYVFMQNSPFDQAEFKPLNAAIVLPSPTDDTMQINRAALWMAKKMFKEDVYYQKAGVMLTNLVPAQGQQTDLFGFTIGQDKSTNLMNTLDSINNKYSKGTIKLASEGINKAWVMRRSFRSPNYTGSWSELPVAK